MGVYFTHILSPEPQSPAKPAEIESTPFAEPPPSKSTSLCRIFTLHPLGASSGRDDDGGYSNLVGNEAPPPFLWAKQEEAAP